ARVRRVRLDLLAQVAHTGPQVIDLVAVLGAPYTREQLTVQQHLAAVGGQFAQEFVLRRGQVNVLALPHDPSPRQVDGEVADREDGRRGLGELRLAARLRTDARELL